MPAVALAVVAAVAAVASAGMAAYSSYQQGKQQKALNDYNAALAEQQAREKSAETSSAANVQRDDGARLLARQRALYAAAGVDSSEGSPLLVQSEQAAALEMSALDIQRKGQVAEANLRAQATLDRLAGESAMQSGRLGAYAAGAQGVSAAAGAFSSALARTPTQAAPKTSAAPAISSGFGAGAPSNAQLASVSGIA